MSDATNIDGKASAANLRAEISRKVALVKEKHGLTPGLSVILVVRTQQVRSMSATRAKQQSRLG